jgi:hypothetical protein
MQQPGDQQPQSQVMYQQPHPSQPAAGAYYQQAPARPGGPGAFVRLIRLLLRRTLYGAVVVGRALRPLAGVLIVGMISLVIIGWMAFQLWGPKPGAPDFARADSIAPAIAVENYLEGRKAFNAEMMWDAFSTDYQTAQLNLGASKATLQSQADSERVMGITYGKVEYIGGVETQDGGSMYFYSLNLSLQSQQVTVPIIFTANADGKIESIMSPLSRLSSSSSSR